MAMRRVICVNLEATVFGSVTWTRVLRLVLHPILQPCFFVRKFLAVGLNIEIHRLNIEIHVELGVEIHC